MGYTHYFTVKSRIPAEPWAQFLEAAQDIIKLAKEQGIKLRDSSTKSIVHINGAAPEDYEDLDIDRTMMGFQFCKTNERPYDVVVVAILCALSDIVGSYYVEVSSDGGPPDWVAGQKLASAALQYNMELPMGMREEEIA